MNYELTTLPDSLREIFLKSYLLGNTNTYRSSKVSATGLFADFGVELPEVRETNVIWATDNYDREDKSVPAHKFADSIPAKKEVLALIIPRSQKAKDTQKRRTKEKAEVFTPSWICNLQNNLVDDELLGYSAFNKTDHESKTWEATRDPVTFPEVYKNGWVDYVLEPRLEITCGEAPYLVSPYDTVTGDRIPVRDEDGRFQRIGLLDRKLRVVSENADDENLWRYAADLAYRATYGYEWQGDNLLLARLNLLNTYIDYYEDKWGKEPSLEDLERIAEVISWNVWQMDGLKSVTPGSCSEGCSACAKRPNTAHDGEVPVIKWNDSVKPFEDFLNS